MPILPPVSAASLFASLPAAAAAASVVPVPPAVVPADIPMAFAFVLYAAATLAIPPSVPCPVPVVPPASAGSTVAAAAAAAIPVLARLPAVLVFVVSSASLAPGTGSVEALAASTFPTRTTAAPARVGPPLTTPAAARPVVADLPPPFVLAPTSRASTAVAAVIEPSTISS
ncbi:unnamed protein product, partial [Ectocarpus sp. 12 AP-2014]